MEEAAEVNDAYLVQVTAGQYGLRTRASVKQGHVRFYLFHTPAVPALHVGEYFRKGGMAAGDLFHLRFAAFSRL